MPDGGPATRLPETPTHIPPPRPDHCLPTAALESGKDDSPSEKGGVGSPVQTSISSGGADESPLQETLPTLPTGRLGDPGRLPRGTVGGPRVVQVQKEA